MYSSQICLGWFLSTGLFLLWCPFVYVTGQLFMGSFIGKGEESVYIPLRKNGIKQLLQSPAHFPKHK